MCLFMLIISEVNRYLETNNTTTQSQSLTGNLTCSINKKECHHAQSLSVPDQSTTASENG